MFTTLAIGAIGVALVAAGWVWVQQSWSRAFPEACSDPDPLAGRIGCHGCESDENCGRRSEATAAPDRRENR